MLTARLRDWDNSFCLRILLYLEFLASIFAHHPVQHLRVKCLCYCIHESPKIDEHDGSDSGTSRAASSTPEVYAMHWPCGNSGMSVLKPRRMDCFSWENFERTSCDMRECVLGLVQFVFCCSREDPTAQGLDARGLSFQ